jgi:hypothetical protein
LQVTPTTVHAAKDFQLPELTSALGTFESVIRRDL